MLKKISHFLWSHRLLASLIIVLGCIPSLYFYIILDADNSVDIWYGPNDPAKLTYDRFTEIFEGDEIILIVYRHKDLFSPRNLRAQHQLVKKLEEIPEVTLIRSLSDSERIFSGIEEGEETLIIKSLADQFGPELNIPDNELKKIKKAMLESPLYRGNILSDDGQLAGILLEVSKLPTAEKGRLVEDVKKALKDFTTDQKIHLSGAPVLDSHFDQISRSDHRIFITLSFICLFAVLLILFRSFIYAFFPVLVVAATVFWVMGCYYWAGLKINVISNLISPLLLCIGIADSVHILTHFNILRQKGLERLKAAQKTVQEMFLPCLFTSLTTGLGFGSFVTSQVVPIKNLGIFSALGIFLAFIISLTLIPTLLTYILRKKTNDQPAKEPAFLKPLLLSIGKMTNHFRYAILGFALALALLAGYFTLQLVIDTTPLEFFKESNPVRQDAEYINDHFAGISNIELFLEAKPDTFKNPKVLEAISRTQAFAEKSRRITSTLSIVHYVKEMHQAFQSGEKKDYRIPDSQAAVAQLLFLYELGEADELYKLVNPDFSATRITLRHITQTSSTSAQLMHQIVQFLKNELKEISNVEVHVEATGITPLYVELDDHLLKSQIKSMLIAFITVFLCMWLLLREFKLSLVAMVANLLPILFTLGFMGATGIYLDVATVMIGSLALGIAVDDTIHFLVRFRRECRRMRQDNPSQKMDDAYYVEAIRLTLLGVGPAITFTSLILFGGFIVLIFGNYRPTIYFGALTSLTMILALLGDLIILPALLLVLRPFLQKK